jgi:hypothetical protein
MGLFGKNRVLEPSYDASPFAARNIVGQELTDLMVAQERRGTWRLRDRGLGPSVEI